MYSVAVKDHVMIAHSFQGEVFGPARRLHGATFVITTEYKTPELNDFIARSRGDRMQTFDQHLLDLLKANKISVDTALSAASNPTDFQTKLSLEGHSPDEEREGGKALEPFEIDSDGRF